MSPRQIEMQAREGRQTSVPDLAKVTGRPRSAFYRAIHKGELKAVWLGKTPMVMPADTLRMLGIETEARSSIAV
ncbi:hypothetical protein [Methylobacterium indicum]|uniref:Helix-turn-helix domain-containing protein n=1 Tax=Methylobacterium indicum TaxID=1775910 RepID=A0ABR5HHC3_9HYPH|nr:hypothetical protein [Methylobacterium indicum]KMO22987.1 hypothetical protein QR78_05640 [Methylobacterium indicum]KMO25674.1 hypothetical protein QR79_06450 [Methylobacterium indicum]